MKTYEFFFNFFEILEILKFLDNFERVLIFPVRQTSGSAGVNFRH